MKSAAIFGDNTGFVHSRLVRHKGVLNVLANTLSIMFCYEIIRVHTGNLFRGIAGYCLNIRVPPDWFSFLIENKKNSGQTAENRLHHVFLACKSIFSFFTAGNITAECNIFFRTQLYSVNKKKNFLRIFSNKNKFAATVSGFLKSLKSLNA